MGNSLNETLPRVLLPRPGIEPGTAAWQVNDLRGDNQRLTFPGKRDMAIASRISRAMPEREIRLPTLTRTT